MTTDSLMYGGLSHVVAFGHCELGWDFAWRYPKTDFDLII